MLPPVLEIYAVWHPDDPAGQTAADQLLSHFHGVRFSGLIGGAVEVYARSRGWRSAADAPRPIPFPDTGPPNGILQAEIVAIVPMLGREFARAVEAGPGPWRTYASEIAAAEAANPERVCVLPLLLHQSATDRTELHRIFGRFQFLAAAAPGAPVEPDAELRCRDLAQSIAQLIGQRRRLQVFISHTKHPSAREESGITELIDRVRWIIGQTRLSEFFDANALQPGHNWDNTLRQGAAVGALIALRTDLYSSREWCQREMLIAKQSGLPVVILDAPGGGDERGSFLMDHVPRVPVRRDASGWSDADIRCALNRLVDESLKRALWQRQARLASAASMHDVAWWAPHAPEPVTLVHWLKSCSPSTVAAPWTLRVLHPDPPLGPDERLVLDEIATLAGFPALDIMTPRLLAARGGSERRRMAELLPTDALRGARIAISVSESPDLERLGLLDIHFRLALGEIARCVLVSGGTLAYGGHLRQDDYTTFLIEELQRYGRRDSPLLICLAWQEHRELKLSELAARQDELGLLGRIVCLDPDGVEMDPTRERDEAAQLVADPAIRRGALTGMRRYMATRTQGRVLLGGKRSGFQGEIPGLMEEALISLENAHPVFLAGGFGGVTADIAQTLGVDDGGWLLPFVDAPTPDVRWEMGRKRLLAHAAQPIWAGLNNGLSDQENRRLAASHRPSEIAAFVSLGLGRLRSPGGA